MYEAQKKRQVKEKKEFSTYVIRKLARIGR